MKIYTKSALQNFQDFAKGSRTAEQLREFRQKKVCKVDGVIHISDPHNILELYAENGRSKMNHSHQAMLSNEQIVENLLSDSVSYGEFVREMLIGVMQSSANKRVYWDAWFRGAKGKKLEEADKGIIYTS